MGGLMSVGYFLFTLFFSLIIFILWTRIALKYFRVSALHPIAQAINTLTNPIINPINRLFSWNKMPPGRYDWGAFIVLLIVEFFKIALISMIFLGGLMPLHYFLMYVVADLIIQPCNLLFYAVIIRVIMSWVNPDWRHPVADILRLVTEPLLRLGRRILPDVSGLDLSPIVVIIGLKIITIFVEGMLPMRVL